MSKPICAFALYLAVAVSASAKPNSPLFESRWESLKITINAFVGGHFGPGALFPLPSPEENCFGMSHATPFTWSGRDCSHPSSFRLDYVSAYLTDLKSFLLTQHVDDGTLQDLKLWISQLPVDTKTTNKFETWVDKQNFGSGSLNSIGNNNGTQSVGFDGGNQLAAVPEPNTVISFLCGVILLCGVLLRRRSVRRRSLR